MAGLVAIPSNQVGNFHFLTEVRKAKEAAEKSQSLQIRSVISIRAKAEKAMEELLGSQSLQIRSVISIFY